MSNIKAIIFDIDGVLTNGSITIDSSGDEIKTFNVRDGQLVDFMRSQGFIFGAISGRYSKSLEYRLKEMNVDFVRLGAKNKYIVLHEFLKEYKLNESEVAYIGDDVIDVEVLKFVAYSYAPNDACTYVKDIVKTVTNSNGGEGVLREVIDGIINNNQKLKSALKSNYKL
jgi:3-deoxy-D-manno-octulosonate 8-phosphate phosphatase (KDO 8-P phosphatase)